MVARDLQRILYRVHDQREKLAPSLELRRAHLTAAFHGQLRAEKDNLEGYIGRLQPGVQRVYLSETIGSTQRQSRHEARRALRHFASL